MQVTYSYPSGRRVVAAVLSVGPDFIRVLAPGRDRVTTLFLRDEDWTTETGVSIRMVALVLGTVGHIPPALGPVSARPTVKAFELQTRAPISSFWEAGWINCDLLDSQAPEQRHSYPLEQPFCQAEADTAQ